MAKEYIERDAVLKEQKTFTEYDEGGWDVAVRAVPVNAIKSIPATDVVEVVRCKDCVHRVYVDMGDDIGEIGGCALFKVAMPLDDFCSYGEKRDENG